jgi:hypothetical protein
MFLPGCVNEGLPCPAQGEKVIKSSQVISHVCLEQKFCSILMLLIVQEGFIIKIVDSLNGIMLFQLLKKTPNQILSSDLGTFHNVDITSIQLALAERQSELPHTSRSGIPVILPDNEMRIGSVRSVK